MKKLINVLRKELYAKSSPGEVLNNLMEDKLKKIVSKYTHDEDALWIGSYLADLFITEAKDDGNIKLHVPMALKYAHELIVKYDISKKRSDIIIEIINTHHGGKQKCIEAKLFKNADCFKFLEPKGVFYLISVVSKGKTEESLKEAIEYARLKVGEKFRLVDLNDDLEKEAKLLHDKLQWIFNRIDLG